MSMLPPNLGPSRRPERHPMIRLAEPVPMGEALARPRLFPGRALGEDEFDRLQAYTDARLRGLLATALPGILFGLEVEAMSGGEGCTVRPGYAVTGAGTLVGLMTEAQATWQGLLARWLWDQRAPTDTGVGFPDASGVYCLVLERRQGLIDAGQALLPCQRTELDPRRDLRQEVLGQLALRRQRGIDATQPVRAQNHFAARNVDGSLQRQLASAVPLALLGVARLDPASASPGVEGPEAAAADYRVAWVAQTPARHLALPDSGYRVLLEQVQEALRVALQAAWATLPNPPSDPQAPLAGLGAALGATLALDFLPAAGALPLPLLEDPAAATPRLHWLPRHLAVDMVPVPEQAIGELIERHLPRPPLDLRRPAGDQIRLLLALDRADYRPDLLDRPVIDAVLVTDLYRTHLRAHQAWRDWRVGFDVLYALRDRALLSQAEVRALALPRAVPQPLRPAQFYHELIDAARGALGIDADLPLPHPYADGVPPAPPFYTGWLVDGAPPPVPAVRDDGLVLRYRAAQVELERLDHRIRALRTRLEKHRDYLLLQRQQLDAQTVSLAALGGGVAGDGSGLQVARWLPFTKLRERAPDPVGLDVAAAMAPSATGSAAAPAGQDTAMAARSVVAVDRMMAGPNVDLAALALAQPQPQPFGVGPLMTKTMVSPVLAPASGAGAATTPGRKQLRASMPSTVETNLQRDRLDRLDAVPKRALTIPSVEGRSYQFGVLDHIQAEVREYEAAYRGMRDLIASLDGLFDPVEATSIRRVLEGFGVPVSPGTLAADQAPRAYPLGRLDLARIERLLDDEQLNGAARTALTAVQAQYQAFLQARDLSRDGLDDYALPNPKRRFEALFEAGQILTRQIAWMEDRYQGLEDRLEGRLRERIRLEGMLERLAALIESAARRLAALDEKRLQALSDYGIAQSLTREDWAAVHRRDQARTEILTKRLRGLYYVRVCETPVSAALPTPLPLRHGGTRDPVPGCDWDTEVELPAVLAEVFATVLEVPFADWRALAPLVPRLPVERVPALLGLHRQRLVQQQAAPRAGLGGEARAGGLAARLSPVLAANRALHQGWATLADPVADSRGRYLAATGQVLSLADALGLSGTVQRAAQALHQRLEQCVVCLLERLNGVAPSLRFTWGQLAEDHRLPAAEPARWPGLERAQAADFNAVRTIAELIDWWFRQLAEEASGAGRAALRNLIRAAVIVAAHGDPARVLSGQVVVPPRRLALGESLRLALNAVPVTGTRLQLLDEAQQVVGLVAVQDQDQGGILAQVVRVDARVTEVTSRFTLVALDHASGSARR